MYLRWLLARCAVAFALEDEARAAWEIVALSDVIGACLALEAEQRLADAIETAVRAIADASPPPALADIQAALLAYLAWRASVSITLVQTLASAGIAAANDVIDRAAPDGLRLHAAFTAALAQAGGG